jgi:hypothetical protein
VLWKLLLVASATLFVVKYAFRTRWAEWSQRIDRAVNITLLAIVISYALYFVWLLLGAPPLGP